jgi:signal transduction histidine kinase
LPAALDLSAFRIVQEALTNTLKHAGPAQAVVTVRYTDGAVELEIADTGRGPSGGHSTGHGLVGMRERAATFGGELEAAPGDEGGFVVRARLPLSVPALTDPGPALPSKPVPA